MTEEQSYSMKGKRVLVSGSGTGIGTGVALAFAQRGADVVFHYSHSEAGAVKGAEQARAMGVKSEAFGADFNDIDQVHGLAGKAIDFLGGVDVLVNNAGITMNAPFEEVTVAQFDTLYNVNIRAMFFLTQAVSMDMLKRDKGAVINLSSVHAYHGLTEHTIYAGTKGAIVAFTRVLSLEMAPKGIRVNAIAPGWIVVENHHKAMGEDLDLDEAAYNIPAGFVGQPHDIGELALFLASDASRYIVGQTLVVDGGQMSIMANMGDFRQRRQWKFGKDYVPAS